MRAGVEARDSSRRWQRALVDFGAEESFARAAQRVREHYGVGVAVSRVRRHTLRHGAQLSAQVVPAPQASVATLVTQMDGSLIPIVTVAGRGADRRQGQQLHWREVRLCLAREKKSATPCYGATLGSVGVAGALWRQTARASHGPPLLITPTGAGHGLGRRANQLSSSFGLPPLPGRNQLAARYFSLSSTSPFQSSGRT